ncbi:MAG: hypothetical protein K8I82_27630, partial [Anaerolineae bacterium]|nr:hypothetical protein [Anaerolineae bacterium]
DGREILGFAPGGGQRMTISGGWIAVAAREGGVRLRQIQPDGSLTGIWQTDTPGTDWQAAVTENQLLAVADSGAGVRFYTISADRLSSISALPELSPAVHLMTTGTTVVAADSQHHLHFADVSVPAAPEIKGRYAPINAVKKALLVDSWVVMADVVDGLKIYDSQTLRYAAGEINHPAFDVQQVNQWLVAAHPDGLVIYDAYRLPALVEVAAVPLWASPTALAARPEQNQVIAAMGNQGLVIVTLNSFRTLAAISVRGTVTDFAVQNDTAYLILDDGRFLILDITNFNAPQIISLIEISGTPQTVQISGSTVVIASGAAGFYVLDLTDSEPQPVLIPAHEFAFDGIQFPEGNLLLLDGNQLRTLDPQTLTELSPYQAVGKSLAVSSQMVIAAGENRIANFSAFGGNLTPLTTYAAPLDITSMQIHNGELLLSSHTPEAALVRLDISNPSRPRETAVYALSEGIEKFALQEDNLVTMNVENHLTHWKINPYRVEFAGSYHPSVFSERITAGNLYGVVDNQKRLTLYETDTPLFAVGNVTALTTSDSGFWYSDSEGNLFFISLDTRQPEQMLQTQKPVTALTWLAKALYIGTRDGQVLRWQNGNFTAEQNDLGEIHDLTPLNDGKIAVSADGLWILEADLTYVQHLPIIALAAAQHENYLAVASGQCGARLFSYPDLQETGISPIGYVKEVVFEGGHLWAVGGDKTTRINLESGFAPAVPYHPQVIQTAEGIIELRWQSHPCELAAYEVSINGQGIARVHEPRYRLAAPLQQDIRWQVTLLTPNGQRINSPEWRVQASYDGWTHSPQQVSHRLTAPDERLSRLWILLGLLMLGVGLVGLGSLIRRPFFVWNQTR